jgi:putative ABC transport system ATP-binding protein
MAKSRNVIEVKNLTKSYFPGGGEVPVLKGLDFEIAQGDFVSIMGPSGSGKSTLMHILGGLDTATSGSYRLADEELSGLDDQGISAIRNRSIGFVFQAFYLIPHSTVLENVLLPSHYGRIDEPNLREKAMSLLKSVGLEERMHFYPNQLSGGQCQRVAIARALLNNPPLILADEPTGNLDTKTGEEIMAILQYLNEMGKTVVLVTHEEEIAMHSHKIMHLRDGLIENWETVENPVSCHSLMVKELSYIFDKVCA